jgi:hypothetical protein
MGDTTKKNILLLKKCLPDFFTAIDVKFSEFRNNDFNITKAIEAGDILLWNDKYFTPEETVLYQKTLNKLVKKIEEIVANDSATMCWLKDYFTAKEGEYLVDLMKEFSYFSPELLIVFNDEAPDNFTAKQTTKFVKSKEKQQYSEVDKITTEFMSKVELIQNEIILNHPFNQAVTREDFQTFLLMTATLFWEYSLKVMDKGIIDLRGVLLEVLYDECIPIDNMNSLLEDNNSLIV